MACACVQSLRARLLRPQPRTSPRSPPPSRSPPSPPPSLSQPSHSPPPRRRAAQLGGRRAGSSGGAARRRACRQLGRRAAVFYAQVEGAAAVRPRPHRRRAHRRIVRWRSWRSAVHLAAERRRDRRRPARSAGCRRSATHAAADSRRSFRQRAPECGADHWCHLRRRLAQHGADRRGRGGAHSMARPHPGFADSRERLRDHVCNHTVRWRGGEASAAAHAACAEVGATRRGWRM